MAGTVAAVLVASRGLYACCRQDRVETMAVDSALNAPLRINFDITFPRCVAGTVAVAGCAMQPRGC